MLYHLRNAAFMLLTCTFIFAGCSAEKKPTKENFQKAIIEWNRQNGGYMLATDTIPLTLPAVNTPKMYVRNFAMLSRAGMVEVVLEPAAETDKSKQQYKYTLTELGKKHYTPNKGFKVSTPEVLEIEDVKEKGGDTKGGVKTYYVRYKFKGIPNDLGKIIYKDTTEGLSGNSALQLDLADTGWKAHEIGH